MELEKRRSRGSFLNLFDWNGKSRKKLSWNNSEMPGKQVKENVGDIQNSQLNRIQVDKNGATSSNIGCVECNSASSVNSDKGCGARAPSVVARLMGLDTLPGSTVPELPSTTSFDSYSLRESHCDRRTPEFLSDYHPLNYTNVPFKMEKSSCNTMESRRQKVQNRPIDRFQTEILPPKAAKSIPVTHHKLLSPIKSPGFIPPKNAAYIMEAAAKIIEANPRACTKSRMSSIGSCAVPLRILDLKEKLESAKDASLSDGQVDSGSVNRVKDRLSDRKNNTSKYIPAFQGSIGSEESSSKHLRSDGKSVSGAIQSKATVHRRGISPSESNRKEQNEVKPSHFSRSQPVLQQGPQQRTSTNRTNKALRQNNQKQNCVSNKGKSVSKVPTIHPTGRGHSSDGPVGPNKTIDKAVNSKIGPQRMYAMTMDNKKELSLSKRKQSSQKKRCTNEDVIAKERVTDNALINYAERSIKCNIANDGFVNLGTDNMKESIDVVSFTFMSPLRRPTPESHSPAEMIGTTNSFHGNSSGDSEKPYPKKLSFSSPGLHMMDGDSLSVLLEKKLQELTFKINLPHCNLVREESSAGSTSRLQDSVPGMVETRSREEDRMFQLDSNSTKLDSLYVGDYSSSGDLVLKENQQWQGSELTEEHSCSSNNSESGKELDCLRSKPVTVFETPFALEGYLANGDSSNGGRKFLLVQPQKLLNVCPSNESVSVKVEGSSPWSFSEIMSSKLLSRTSRLTGFQDLSNWELKYVKDILNNSEFEVEDLVLGQANKVIMPNIFDLLETQEYETESNGKECSKLERRVLFDGVCECLAFRCRKIVVGRCKAWPRWMTLVQRKSWLAENLYREMLGWKSMGEHMLDELVSNDMSTQYGRWLDFSIEAFEEGVEIEWGILTSLVDELVSDLLIY
ncbi:DUF4378 domain protein [Quillaja saponaria]|uniref:DUF4378 domain protein n=1 Tax=Quillaja saponaria TaxID=32244 RepID=A0AAD7VJI9_QUISA|nr:DUF4378 domain protein [Quillaja saponaria]